MSELRVRSFGGWGFLSAKKKKKELGHVMPLESKKEGPRGDQRIWRERLERCTPLISNKKKAKII